MKYTYLTNSEAHYNGEIVVVPDQVAYTQKAFDQMPFPARKRDGSVVRVVLRGDLYGLHTTGTGDMVVTAENRKKARQK